MATISLSATERLAAFAVSARDFPALARKRAVDAITDCVGCMLAGSRQPLARPIARALPTYGERTDEACAALVGTTRYASPVDAVLFNGAIAHALDFDDTNHPGYAHPSAVIVPVLMAVAATERITGREMIAAYIVGLEVFGKLGRVLNREHYHRGWHPTATFGTLAAAVVAGRLLRLDAQQLQMAIGIAASAAGGLRVNFGSMVKPLHSGYAARNGLLAARLAREGFESSSDVLDRDYGYFALFGNPDDIDTRAFQALGEPLEILGEYGLALKPYPSCGATHPGIEAAIALHSQLAGRKIRAVHAGVCEMAFEPLIYVVPRNSLQAKFSMHYCLAVGLLEGAVNLDSFALSKICDATVLDLIARIRMEVDERLRDNGEFATILRVETDDGDVLETSVELALGKPARWLSREQLKAKFDDCVGTVPLAAAVRDAIFDRLQALDCDADAAELFAILHGHEAALPSHHFS